jgi:hypothetical protein
LKQPPQGRLLGVQPVRASIGSRRTPGGLLSAAACKRRRGAIMAIHVELRLANIIAAAAQGGVVAPEMPRAMMPV